MKTPDGSTESCVQRLDRPPLNCLWGLRRSKIGARRSNRGGLAKAPTTRNGETSADRPRAPRAQRGRWGNRLEQQKSIRAWGCSHATKEQKRELVGFTIRAKVQSHNKQCEKKRTGPPAAEAPEKPPTCNAQPKDSGAPGWYFDFGELGATEEARAAGTNEDQTTAQEDKQSHERNGEEQ